MRVESYVIHPGVSKMSVWDGMEDSTSFKAWNWLHSCGWNSFFFNVAVILSLVCIQGKNCYALVRAAVRKVEQKGKKMSKYEPQSKWLIDGSAVDVNKRKFLFVVLVLEIVFFVYKKPLLGFLTIWRDACEWAETLVGGQNIAMFGYVVGTWTEQVTSGTVYWAIWPAVASKLVSFLIIQSLV